MLKKIVIIICVAVVLSTLTGCAKFPSTPAVTNRQLVITLKVRGSINPLDASQPLINRHYFVAIDNDNDPNTGPLAALYPPYGGTGWVTSQNAQASVGLTSFIQYDAQNPEGYVYGVLPGSFFLNRTSPQPTIRTEIIEGGSAIRFTIDFSQIATTAIPADQIQQLDINFITTNALPNGNQYIEGREIDGLGPAGQDYITISTNTDRAFTDEDTDAGNFTVTDSDLDIVSWTIEVQTVSSR
ncbi:MAG: hypothetical protein ABFD54_14355 [Armatimonadota bacterium]|nr:hypothetical protein [bacterium]